MVSQKDTAVVYNIQTGPAITPRVPFPPYFFSFIDMISHRLMYWI